MWIAWLSSAVPSPVQPMPDHSPGAGFQRCCPVGHSELCFGRIAAGVADLGENRRCDECADTVDFTQAGSASGDQAFDLGGEISDPSVEFPQCPDPSLGDPGVRTHVPPQQPHRPVEGFAGSQPANVLLVAGTEFAQIGVESVGLRGAVPYQLAAV